MVSTLNKTVEKTPKAWIGEKEGKHQHYFTTAKRESLLGHVKWGGTKLSGVLSWAANRLNPTCGSQLFYLLFFSFWKIHTLGQRYTGQPTIPNLHQQLQYFHKATSCIFVEFDCQLFLPTFLTVQQHQGQVQMK